MRKIFLIVFLLASFFSVSTNTFAQSSNEFSNSVSVEVVKADFSQTMWAVKSKGNDVYEMTIRVPNSGTYHAEEVEVIVTSIADWRYLSSTASREHSVHVDDGGPQKAVQWLFPSIAIGEEARIQALFHSLLDVDALMVYVKVNSRVSAPVAVATQIVTDDGAVEHTTQEASSTPSSKFSVWFQNVVQKGQVFLRSFAHGLNQHMERLFDWIHARLE